MLRFGETKAAKEIYLQGYLDNWAYKTVSKQMTDYLDESLFED